VAGGQALRGDDYFGFVGGMDPAAGFVDVGWVADGVEDVPGGEALGDGILDYVSEGQLQVASAQREKIEGVGVVVNGGSGPDIPTAHDRIRTAPLQKRFLDIFAVGMVADGTFAGMALEWGGFVGIVRRKRLIFGWGCGRPARF
jgi:hypothetical protein